MKKRLWILLLAICMVMTVFPMTAFAANGALNKGTGAENDPYLIEDLADLVAFRDSVNAGNNYAGQYVQLAASIDMSSIANWTPIGDPQVDASYNPVDANKVFSGVFDGNNQVLSNLKIEKHINGSEGADEEANLGLFSIIGAGATVKNLTITNVAINTDGRNVGALAGVTYGSIDNITVNGNIQIVGGNNVSGVGGMNRKHAVSATNVTLSGNDGSAITGNNIVGGIFAEIAPNGNAHTFQNLNVENVAISGVGGVGGVVGLLTQGTISAVSVQNVKLVGNTVWAGHSESRIRLGSVAGLLGNAYSTISNIAVANVTAKNIEGEDVELPVIGANYGSSSNATEAKIGDVYYATLVGAVSAAEGDTITLLADVNLAAKVTSNKSLTIDFNGNKIVCAGEDYFAVPGYVCIPGSESGTYEVVAKDSNVTVDTAVSAGQSSVDIPSNIPASVKDAVNDAFKTDNMKEAAADSAAGLVAAAGSMANDKNVVGDTAITTIAKEIAENQGITVGTEDTAAELLEKVLDADADITVQPGDKITVHVQPYLDIELTQIESSEPQPGNTPEIVSLTVEIEPMYNLVATTAEGNNPIVTSGTGKNAVVLDTQPMTVEKGSPVTITIPLPTGFSVPSTNKIYIIHVKDVNTQYVYEGIVAPGQGGQNYVTFVNPNGFSSFTVTAAHGKVAKIGDEYFDTLAAAIAKVKDGEMIELLDNCSAESAAVVARNVSFTINPNGYTYTAPVPGANTTMTPGTATAGDSYTFTVQWNGNGVFDAPGSGMPPFVTDPLGATDVFASEGDTATMSVTAADAQAYQWYIDRGNAEGFVEIPGAVNAQYTTSELKAQNNGYRYFCRVSNTNGSIDSPVFTIHLVTVELPKTGDAPALWGLLLLFAGAGVGLALWRKYKAFCA